MGHARTDNKRTQISSGGRRGRRIENEQLRRTGGLNDISKLFNAHAIRDGEGGGRGRRTAGRALRVRQYGQCLIRFFGGAASTTGGVCWVASALNTSASSVGCSFTRSFHPSEFITSVAFTLM